MSLAEEQHEPRSIGRYVLFKEVAHGGMATVHLGRLRGPAGFARTVAIKRLHPQFARDPEFVAMFLDEARLAARIQNPNVVSVLDVVTSEGELFLVMDYVHGESLHTLLSLARKQSVPLPQRTLVAIIIGVLNGLEAAHEARSEHGDPLDIVHRDMSPQNVLLSLDGVARVLDFGVAKASLRVHWSTKDGQIKGKLGYMSPEQLTTGMVDRRADIYAVGVMLWEGLVGRRLVDPSKYGDIAGLLTTLLKNEVEMPGKLVPSTPKTLDAVVAKALARSREERFATAREMAEALERAVPPTPQRMVGEWVTRVAGPRLASRAAELNRIERTALPPMGTSMGSLPDFHAPSPVSEEDFEAGANDGDRPSPAARQQSGNDLAGLVPKAAPSRPSTPMEAPTGDEMAVSTESLDEEHAQPPAARATSDSSATQPPPADDDSDSGLVPPPLFTWRRAWSAALGVLCVALGLVSLRACTGGRHDASAASAVPTPSPLASMALPVIPVIPVIPVGPTATDIPSPPDPLEIDGPTPGASAPVARASTAALGAPPAARKKSKARPNCDPPFTIDANGVRIPKRECF